mgnify:CR=1 FL=1
MFRKFIFPACTRITQNRYSTRQSSERGQLVLAAALICGALGIDTDLTLNYQLFALLLVLLFSARITVRFHKPAILVKRILPRHVTWPLYTSDAAAHPASLALSGQRRF